ncbi:amidohydrolase [Novosphingobium pokkalii]|uniref:Amidohydrolase n=1 Tax=Novosphingobium pokkalii TaxID=1770194 RepID=A0ABV7V9J4_9SPHN|nr:amidohydrolase [Novosphingobium pokkalii]GHC99738.1 amidohydrolase [Novosphingobium pokkalii]
MPFLRPLALLTGSSLIATAANAATAPAADTVLLHGQIHTIDAHDSVAQALAIKDGRIVYVGGDAGAKAFTGPATQTIDLKGGVVMPGLVDAHMHPLEGGSGLLACDLQYKRLTVPEFQAALSACAAKEGAGHDGKWLIAVHWFQQEMQPLGIEMTKAMLDALPTTRPVAVFSSFGHSALVNSRGLALAGIDAKTPDPVGGGIHHDATGAPTGLLEDAAQDLVRKHVPAPTPEDDVVAARAALAAMAAQGVTTFLDADAPLESIRAFSVLSKAGELTARGHFAPHIAPEEGPAPEPALLRIVEWRRTYDQGAAQVQPTIMVRTIKLYMDGVITAPAFTGVMLAPYLENHGTAEKPDWQPGTNKGPAPYFPPPVLAPLLDRITALGFDPHMHADGDGAVRIALDAVAALRKSHPARDVRPAVAHDEIVDPADFPRYKALGVTPVLSLQWGKLAADTVAGAKDFLGPKRYAFMEPSGLLAKAGARITFGSDWPVDPLNEWFALKVGVTRRNDPSAGPEYSQPLPGGPPLTVAQTVRAATINAAWSLRAEGQVGSLERGKFADLIWIDRNIFAGDPDAIAQTRVLLTMVGGKVVYRAP